METKNSMKEKFCTKDFLESLVIRPVSAEKLQVSLSETIYTRPLKDVALVVYMELESDNEDYVTAMLPRSVAELMGLPEGDLFRRAYENTCARQQPRIYGDSMEVFEVLDRKQGNFMEDGGCFHVRARGGNTLTTTQMLNGAVAIFEPGVAEKLGDILQDDFYVTFPSIHFAKIHKKSGAALTRILYAAKQMRTAPNPEEYLSDQVYYYSRSRKSLGVVQILEENDLQEVLRNR